MKFLKIVGFLLLGIVVLVLGACGWAMAVANGKYEKQWQVHDVSFPIPWPLDPAEADSLGGADPAAVAMERAVSRGQHLVDSRVGCTGCHGADFGGGLVIDVPIVARWVAPNLTAGEGSVTRGFAAHDWDRAVRHGVRRNGRSSSMPCAEFSNLSDHELSDIVAYIQSRPPVNRDLGKVRLGPVFWFAMATDPNSISAFTIDHEKPHPLEPPVEGPTAELGEHIVQVCRGCHGPNLSGGKMAGDPNMPIVANITPHASGVGSWSEADFVRAMREGKRPDGSAISEMMPWKAFGKMTDAELSALWAYLRTVPPREKGNH